MTTLTIDEVRTLKKKLVSEHLMRKTREIADEYGIDIDTPEGEQFIVAVWNDVAKAMWGE